MTISPPCVIEPYQPAHLEAVVALSLRAWAPVFPEIERALDPAVYRAFFPDWRVSQAESVRATCTAGDAKVWVATDGTVVAGFVALKVHPESSLGEIYMIAVDPELQQRGLGSELTAFALEWMRTEGLAVAMVETGGDPGHAPARRTYEKAGFQLSPVSRYFKKL